MKKYARGVLYTVTSGGKNALKGRWIYIMKNNKKSKNIIIISSILVVGVMLSVIALWTGIGSNKEKEEVGKHIPQNFLYDLDEISKHKTPYVGDSGRVTAIIGKLPVPDNYFKQQYISMKTSQEPYSLTVYYEPVLDIENESKVTVPDAITHTIPKKNALVLFSMIDNLDEVAFEYRTSQSNGELDTSKYDVLFTFKRADFEEEYGDLSILSKNLDLLENALNK